MSMSATSSSANRFVLIGTDGRYRVPIQVQDTDGQLKYKVGTGRSGQYELVEDLGSALDRVLLHGKTIAAKHLGASDASSTGVKVPGRSITGYWLSPELQSKFKSVPLLPLTMLLSEPASGKPPRDGLDWTDGELTVAVEGYMTLLASERSGILINKKALYRSIASRLERSVSSVDRRMQNISSVLALMGREFVKGLLPAAHAGAEVAGRIEQLIQQVESQPRPPVAAFEEQVSKLLKRGLDAPPKGSEKPTAKTMQTTVYDRDPAVKAWVLQRSNGKCEACPNPAPFLRSDGTPYLEVHHLRPLADGGSDKPCNAIAICPNCHRWLHYGRDAGKVRKYLLANVAELIEE